MWEPRSDTHAPWVPCRFLVRLLLVHGSLSVYRLARLIKYSFYKNITLAFLLFMLQPFGGWSGAQLLLLCMCIHPGDTHSNVCRFHKHAPSS